MIKCARHPQRRRKDCETCQGPEPAKQSDSRIFVYPHVTEDGLTWLDPDDNPPVVGNGGLLTKPFVLQLKYGARERWGVGLVLPLTPEAHRRWVAGIIEQRKKAGG